MTRRRIVWTVMVSAVGLLAASLAGGWLVLRSRWFHERVRTWLVSEVETATGGRAELGDFQLDWRNLRARVAPFTLHGAEPAGKPPLFRAASVEIGLKIVSVFRRDVNLTDLEVTAPRIYLIVEADGRTNLPGPKIASRPSRSPIEAVLKLAIGRFQVDHGEWEVEGRGRRPFAASGRNLQARLLYDASGPRYRGEIAMDPLDVRGIGLPALPKAAVKMAVTFERNRVAIESASLRTADSTVDFQGALENLTAPRAAFQFRARLGVREGGRVLGIPELQGGVALVEGKATWSEPAGILVAGNLHATQLTYRDRSTTLRDFRVDGLLEVNAGAIELRGARLAGAMVVPAHLPVEGRIARATLRGRNLDLEGVALAVLGGSFQGKAELRDLRRYRVEGDFSGFEARRVVALYSQEALPWDGRLSGTGLLEGVLGRPDQLRASGEVNIAPAPQGAPVNGQISASYAVASGALDLGRSTLSLPSSRVDFSGSMGTRLQAHLETRDLSDLLPAIGRSAASLPVKLENGDLIFDGTVTGNLDAPRIGGHLRATRVVYEGRLMDALEADVTAAPDAVSARNGSVEYGSLRARFQGQLGLRQWNPQDDSPVAASLSLLNGTVADAMALARTGPNGAAIEASGTFTASAEVTGTFGNPQVTGNLEVTKGAVQGEPFDRFTAQLRSGGNRIELASGQIAAGAKQVRLAGAFDHPAGQLSSGRLRFQVSTNAMPIQQIHTLESSRPGLQGTVQVTASGEAAVGAEVRLSELHAEIDGRGLRITGQALGDATLTANSDGPVLRAHLESNFADSSVRGDGEWRLEGDQPGSATVTFSRLDFAQLRSWLAPSLGPASPAGETLAGFAEGQLRIEGPLGKRAALVAELRVSSFEIRRAEKPAAGTVAGPVFALHNSGPIVARLSNSVVTMESAHLVGPSTDLAITGKIALDQKSPLDLRIDGHVDLAILHDLDRDFTSSGAIATNATVRGTFDAPQIVGRVEFQDAAFSLDDFPNGVSKATGAIVFTGDRATIQRFTGETGGGKIELSGFASYGSGATVYRLNARVQQVRVRYPEGVSTVADANLSLTGTRDQSMLAGTVTVLRTGFNPQSDFSSLIARSSEPVRTPSAQTGLIGGMGLSIQINTASDLQFQSSLTADLRVEANLTLRGTLSNPALLGRISLTEGQVIFYGTNYHINQGSISFYNPLRIDPIVDIDLETKAHGIDITLTVSGPLTHPNLTPHSDPPLQFSEIVALLATGRTPTSDPTMLAEQSTAPQSWQQMGASALLGQAIASPVAGRLQRFFGVSKLRIDPTLPGGVENNPQARLTLEQQVTPAITFTYITNVTNSNPQVIRVEWAWSKQWSVVALREENGVFGLDFFYKKRF